MHFALLALLAFALHSPIFLKLPKLSPSRMGHYGQAQTPGQGQDIGRYPLMQCHCYHRMSSKVAAILGVIGENVFRPFSP